MHFIGKTLRARTSIHEKYSNPLPSSTLVRQGPEALPGTLPEGNHHRRPSSSPCLPPEWCVSSSPLDYGSIAVARWLSSPLCASCLDLVSCLHDQDHLYVISHVVFVGIWWILSTMSSSLLIYHVYVIFDLACSPLLVDTLAKYMLVTPRGSIYAR
jgi:hypothetical protein